MLGPTSYKTPELWASFIAFYKDVYSLNQYGRHWVDVLCISLLLCLSKTVMVLNRISSLCCRLGFLLRNALFAGVCCGCGFSFLVVHSGWYIPGVPDFLPSLAIDVNKQLSGLQCD